MEEGIGIGSGSSSHGGIHEEHGVATGNQKYTNNCGHNYNYDYNPNLNRNPNPNHNYNQKYSYSQDPRRGGGGGGYNIGGDDGFPKQRRAGFSRETVGAGAAASGPAAPPPQPQRFNERHYRPSGAGYRHESALACVYVCAHFLYFHTRFILVLYVCVPLKYVRRLKNRRTDFASVQHPASGGGGGRRGFASSYSTATTATSATCSHAFAVHGSGVSSAGTWDSKRNAAVLNDVGGEGAGGSGMGAGLGFCVVGNAPPRVDRAAIFMRCSCLRSCSCSCSCSSSCSCSCSLNVLAGQSRGEKYNRMLRILH